MDLKCKIGNLYHVELNKNIIPVADGYDEQDFAAYLSWEFIQELPGFVDVTCFFGFEIGLNKYFVDGWSAKADEDPKVVIQRYLKEALDALRTRKVLDAAISNHILELEEK